MGSLRFLVDEETTELQPKRHLTLSLYGTDGSRRFVGSDGTPSENWSGRWVELTRVPDEPTLWEGIVSGIPAGRYFIQLRMVEDRNARPVSWGGGEVPPEFIDVRQQPLPIAFVMGYAKDLMP